VITNSFFVIRINSGEGIFMPLWDVLTYEEKEI
jgi:hypothetical protein